eukprot:CAMPEP_0171090398 /NCGR_PEP_ID=MMETSP0766_2-20121228/30707_1 /TAXON_ID=439317 /ORGANISM="Gambierdiscus australes, Strain CAWD 149" /LENGTH=39 /DNA_ID= /DNA_START= /DNA_END= /DNA_ORIENTATION=
MRVERSISRPSHLFGVLKANIRFLVDIDLERMKKCNGKK